MTPVPGPSSWPPGWWLRLHQALMPEYNRRTTLFWWLATLAGAVALAVSLFELRGAGWLAWLQIACAVALAMLAGLFPVRVPGTRNSLVVGEIFIFLVLLLQGPAAATLVAAGEAAIGSYRTSKRWTSRIVSPAIAALVMHLMGSVLTQALAWLEQTPWAGAPSLLAAAMLFAFGYFLLNASLMGAVPRLKRGEPMWQLATTISDYRWVGLAYAGSASVASLLFMTYRQSGVAVLMVMVPLLLMLLVSLHFYFRQQEATEAMREAHAEAADREAALVARESAAAERHLLELQASERRFHAAFAHASIGMALLDFDGRVLQANLALRHLLDRPDEALVGQAFGEFMQPDDRPALDAELAGARGDGFQGFARELRCQGREGDEIWASLHCSAFTEPGSNTACLILQVQDVSARRRAEAGLHHLAFHDSLTGLPNRRRFLECLAGAVQRCRVDPAHRYAVMFLDFDRFKLVNDSLGHKAGDELLSQLSRRIQENLRPGDVVARLGGDEFAVLAEHIEHEHEAVLLAERLMKSLERPFTLGGVDHIASASIGITFSAFGYDSPDDVLRDADTAMYKAKSAGRARYSLFDASLHAAVSERLRLEGEVRRAVDEGQLAVVYQPLVELATGRLSGFEALLRWEHPASGTLGPVAFLQVAEEVGLMERLSDFVLHCACRQLRQWQLAAPELADLSVSVNISAQDISQRAFVARVGRALVESGLQPRHLTLELTEGMLMSGIESAAETLADLRRLGTQVAVDDFGVGYSSLSRLAKLPIDSLKIDRSFVSQLQRGSDEAAVVQAIIQLGGTLRKSVVAEGIESADQLQQLRDMGCEFGQGFHLALPLSAQAAGELVSGHRPGATLH